MVKPFTAMRGANLTEALLLFRVLPYPLCIKSVISAPAGKP